MKTRSSTCATLNEFGSPTKKKLVKKNKQEHGCERGNAKKGKEKQAAKPAIKSDWGEGKQKTKKNIRSRNGKTLMQPNKKKQHYNTV